MLIPEQFRVFAIPRLPYPLKGEVYGKETEGIQTGCQEATDHYPVAYLASERICDRGHKSQAGKGFRHNAFKQV
jgi:hypothetical protein